MLLGPVRWQYYAAAAAKAQRQIAAGIRRYYKAAHVSIPPVKLYMFSIFIFLPLELMSPSSRIRRSSRIRLVLSTHR